MDVRLTWTDSDEAGDNVVPNVLSPRDDNDETVLHTTHTSEPRREKTGFLHDMRKQRRRSASRCN